ncbi:MAG TPA: tetraacyldisaccharide 4'-kinase [Flavobacteriaceae bacterium]|nr:tetraacyldisaccharide 4'-kinase [Flavobacteriaceae bacterium]
MNKLRKILFPFSILYDGVTRFRNSLYENGIFKSEKFDLPVICVGNLNVGGTGKSPMIEFLIKHLTKEHKIAVLSRGYKRKTKGFLEVQLTHNVLDVGDEPLQFKKKFPKVTVAVDADRRNGIKNLKNTVDVILLDDAFQHRKVSPSYTILLTAYENLYADDFLLPAGNLRETANEAKRADCIVVTKCPKNLSDAERHKIQKKLKLNSQQQLYFSTIAYAEAVENASESIKLSELREQKFTLVTGIANPKPLVDHLVSMNLDYDHFNFSDHHNFTTSELEQLNQKKLLITTEKDFVRLENNITSKLYYLPIEVEFLENEIAFMSAIKKSIADFK